MKTNKEVLKFMEERKGQIEIWCCFFSQHIDRDLDIEKMLDYLFEKLKKHKGELKKNE